MLPSIPKQSTLEKKLVLETARLVIEFNPSFSTSASAVI